MNPLFVATCDDLQRCVRAALLRNGHSLSSWAREYGISGGNFRAVLRRYAGKTHRPAGKAGAILAALEAATGFVVCGVDAEAGGERRGNRASESKGKSGSASGGAEAGGDFRNGKGSRKGVDKSLDKGAGKGRDGGHGDNRGERSAKEAVRGGDANPGKKHLTEGGRRSMRKSAEEARAEAHILAYIGRNVRSARETLGMTQERLSARTGISQDQISRIECGERRPTVAQLLAITQALRISPSRLLDENPHLRLRRGTSTAAENRETDAGTA